MSMMIVFITLLSSKSENLVELGYNSVHQTMIEIVFHGLHLVLMFAVLEPCNLDLIEDML